MSEGNNNIELKYTEGDGIVDIDYIQHEERTNSIKMVIMGITCFTACLNFMIIIYIVFIISICFIIGMITIGNRYIQHEERTNSIKMVIIPHEDDEIFSFCGSIQNMLENGDDVKVVLLTNGDYYSTQIGKDRLMESVEALKCLDFPKEKIIALGYGDSIISDMGSRCHLHAQCSHAKEEYISGFLLYYQLLPQQIYMLHYGQHDHHKKKLCIFQKAYLH